MPDRAAKTDPRLWETVKAKITAGDKGGKPGQWSARKAQMAVHAYKAAGGGYEGGKDPQNHLVEWTREEWGTKSGAESLESGERYLPKAAREAMSDEEYARTTKAKTATWRRASSSPLSPRTSRPRRRGFGNMR